MPSRNQPPAIRFELGAGRECFVHEQVRDFLETGVGREFSDIVTAVVQIVAGLPDGGDRGVAGRHAGKRDGFFGRVNQRCAHERILGLKRTKQEDRKAREAAATGAARASRPAGRMVRFGF